MRAQRTHSEQDGKTLCADRTRPSLPSRRCAEYLLNPEGTLKKVGAQEPGQADQSVVHQGEEVLVGGVATPKASLPVQRCNSAKQLSKTRNRHAPRTVTPVR